MNIGSLNQVFSNRDAVVFSYCAKNVQHIEGCIAAVKSINQTFPNLQFYIDSNTDPVNDPCGQAEWDEKAKRAAIFVVFVSLEFFSSKACIWELEQMVSYRLVHGIPIVPVLVSPIPDDDPFRGISLERNRNGILQPLSEMSPSELYSMGINLHNLVKSHIKAPKYIPILSESIEKLRAFLRIHPRFRSSQELVPQFADFCHLYWNKDGGLYKDRSIVTNPTRTVQEMIDECERVQPAILTAPSRSGLVRLEPLDIYSDEVKERLFNEVVGNLRGLNGGLFPVNIERLATSLGIEEIVSGKLPGAGRLEKTASGGLRIILKDTDNEKRKRFTACHELVHATLSHLVPTLDQRLTWVEPFCNNVAGELLMPYDLVTEFMLKHKIDPKSLREASEFFEVSMRSMAVRCDRIFGISTAKVQFGTMDWSEGAIIEAFTVEDFMVITDTVTRGQIGHERFFFEGPKCSCEFMWEQIDQDRVNVVVYKNLDAKYKSEWKAQKGLEL